MALFVLRKLILQTRMRSDPVGLDVWFLVGLFVYSHASCERTVKALARLRGCTGSPELSLVAYVISTIISRAHSQNRFSSLSPSEVSTMLEKTNCTYIQWRGYKTFNYTKGSAVCHLQSVQQKLKNINNTALERSVEKFHRGLGFKHVHHTRFRYCSTHNCSARILEVLQLMKQCINWAESWENLFMPYANNKGANQPAQPRSLISAFVVRCLDCIISLVCTSEFSSRYLVSVAAQVGLSLTWWETPKWRGPLRKHISTAMKHWWGLMPKLTLTVREPEGPGQTHIPTQKSYVRPHDFWNCCNNPYGVSKFVIY